MMQPVDQTTMIIMSIIIKNNKNLKSLNSPLRRKRSNTKTCSFKYTIISLKISKRKRSHLKMHQKLCLPRSRRISTRGKRKSSRSLKRYSKRMPERLRKHTLMSQAQMQLRLKPSEIDWPRLFRRFKNNKKFSRNNKPYNLNKIRALIKLEEMCRVH